MNYLSIEELRIRFNHDRNELRDALFHSWIFSNIDCYDFQMANIKIKACIDFIDIQFETDEFHPYSNIKKYLTEQTGISHFIEPLDGNMMSSKNFLIRLHDIHSMDALHSRLTPLQHYISGLSINDLHIQEIELAMDFYNAPDELALALFKAIRLAKETSNIRLYGKYKKDLLFFKLRDTDIHKKVAPTFTPYVLDYLRYGGCEKYSNGNIGINPKTAPIYYHIYLKRTDHGGLMLLPDKHRIRVELNIKQSELSNAVIGKLTSVINKASKLLQFIKLKTTATKKEKVNFYRIYPYGLEVPCYYDNHRNKRKLLRFIESNPYMNKIKRDVFKTLADKFLT